MARKINSITYTDDLKNVLSADKNIKIANIKETVKSLESYAFADCKDLIIINFPEDLTFIGNLAFIKCESLSEITLPPKIEVIGEGTFFECKGLEKINLPEKLRRIGMTAFERCSSLKEIIIPENVTYIGNRAFKECNNLEKVIYKGTLEQWEKVNINAENTKFQKLALKTLYEKEKIIQNIEEELGDTFTKEEINRLALEEILN